MDGQQASPADEPRPDLVIPRRRLLRLMATGGGIAALGSALSPVGSGFPLNPAALLGIRLDLGLLGSDKPPVRVAPPSTLLAVRPEDGLLVHLSFVNLDILRSRTRSSLALRNPAVDGLVVVTFPPQSLFEQAILHTEVSQPVPTGVLPAVMSGPSRLAMRVVAGSPPVPWTLSGVLNLGAYPLSVSSVAEGTARPDPAQGPAPTETAIEAPWRLVLSPPATARFSAATQPVARNGRTELWHARAVAARTGSPADQMPGAVPVRAIWSPDLAATPPDSGQAFTTVDDQSSLIAADRREIVKATTDPAAEGVAGPAAASLLLLSPMGASLDVRGAWPNRNSIVSWRHRSYLGRDNYVKVEYPGFLFPWGFRAVLVKITERIIRQGVAFQRKEVYIVVREPVVHFGDVRAGGLPLVKDEGRGLPFLEARTTTITSPRLIPSDPRDSIGGGNGRWVRVGEDLEAGLLRYRLLLTDHAGGVVAADMPLIFVRAGDKGAETETEPAYDKALINQVVTDYNRAQFVDRRKLTLGGQKVAYVPRHPAGEDPAMPTAELLLAAELSAIEDNSAALNAARRMNGNPRLVDAHVRIEALDTIGGTQAAATRIELHPTYIGQGLPGPESPAVNPGEVWAKVLSATNLAVPQQIGGGLAAPRLAVEGLSRALGPVADPEQIANGHFNPEAFFPADDITLLGGIKLKDVLDGLVPAFSDPRSDDANAPRVVTTREGSKVTTEVTWHPKLKTTIDGLFEPSANAPDDRLDLQAVFVTDPANGVSSTTVRGDLRDFNLYFVGPDAPLAFIKQNIRRLHFESRDGAKPSVDIALGPSSFEGELKFLHTLQDKLPALPGGVKIDVTPEGVSAGLNLALPSVSVGVLLLQNLSIGVRLDLPFNGDQATLTFNFATREKPFNLTVSLFGGGGFLAIGVGTRGVQSIEGAIEFGAAVALDLFVASGSVSIMAGIYMKYAQKMLPDGSPANPATPGKTLVITGYVRAVGELEVLGIITVSVEFYLGLSFQKELGPPAGRARVEGVATLTVRVEVLLFSTEVSLTVKKEFGAGIDPSFGDQLTEGDWAGYCAAFAS